MEEGKRMLTKYNLIIFISTIIIQAIKIFIVVNYGHSISDNLYMLFKYVIVALPLIISLMFAATPSKKVQKIFLHIYYIVEYLILALIVVLYIA